MPWVMGIDFGQEEIQQVPIKSEGPLLREQVEVNFNPHYIAYAAAQGRSPAEQLEHDRLEWPGGCMGGFQLWMSSKKKEFRAAHPEAFLGEAIADLEAWIRFVKGGV